LLGDRGWLCIRPSQVAVSPRNGRAGPNQIALDLLRVVDRPGAVRLEFSGDIAAEVPRSAFEAHKHNREWVVEFPPGALRLL
jgi:hypothetical protein